MVWQSGLNEIFVSRHRGHFFCISNTSHWLARCSVPTPPWRFLTISCAGGKMFVTAKGSVATNMYIFWSREESRPLPGKRVHFISRSIESANSDRRYLPQGILHFSYGANMSLEILQRKRGLKPLSSQPAQVTDLCIKLAFQHRGGFATLLSTDGAGDDTHHSCGDIHPDSTELVTAGPHGALYSLTREDLLMLQRAETGYQLVEIRVTPYQIATAQPAALSMAETVCTQPCDNSHTGSRDDGRHASVADSDMKDTLSDGNERHTACTSSLVATVFVSKPMLRLQQAVPPSERYLALLKAGAREQGLSSAYCDWLAKVPSVSGSAYLRSTLTHPLASWQIWY